jgi:hypothetical protein
MDTASGNPTLGMSVEMLGKGCSLLVVKTVFSPNEKNRVFFLFHHEQNNVDQTSW